MIRSHTQFWQWTLADRADTPEKTWDSIGFKSRRSRFALTRTHPLITAAAADPRIALRHVMRLLHDIHDAIPLTVSPAADHMIKAKVIGLVVWPATRSGQRMPNPKSYPIEPAMLARASRRAAAVSGCAANEPPFVLGKTGKARTAEKGGYIVR